MKKILSVLCVITLLSNLWGCSTRIVEDGNKDIPIVKGGDRTNNKLVSENYREESGEGLSILTSEVFPYCNTEDGYYYISTDVKQLRDGSYGAVIMYMDFATQKEVYLCSNAGCNHDTESCSAIILQTEFSPEFGRMFIHGDKLYLLSCGVDTEGTVSFGFSDSGLTTVESAPDALYRMNLDGTNREKIYTFSDGVTSEETVLGDGNSLYFITKELSEDSGITTASKRQLVRYDILTGKVKTVASLNIDGGSHWRVIGATDMKIVLEGVSYGEDYLDDNDYSASQWSEIFSNSKTKYVSLDVDSGELISLYGVDNSSSHGAAVLNGSLFVSEGSSKDIIRIDLESGNQNKLASLEQSNIIGTMGEMLVCRTWDMTENYNLYFVDTHNGNVSTSTLANKYNGWALELMGETKDKALVIYDYKAEALEDGAYEIYQYKFALISKSDLYAGKDNYYPIQMIGGGR